MEERDTWESSREHARKELLFSAKALRWARAQQVWGAVRKHWSRATVGCEVRGGASHEGLVGNLSGLSLMQDEAQPLTNGFERMEGTWLIFRLLTLAAAWRGGGARGQSGRQ